MHYQTDPLLIIKSVLYFSTLIYAGYQDNKSFRIPDKVHLIIIILALIGMQLGDIKSSFLGLFAVSVPLLVLSLIQKNGMGGGDIKFMAANGFFLGAAGIICAGGIGLTASLVLTTIFNLMKRKKLNSPIALAPYLGFGCAFIWIFTKLITVT